MNGHWQHRLKVGSAPAWHTARPKQREVKGFKATPELVGGQRSDLLVTRVTEQLSVLLV